jgi:hypothetical protein
MRKINDIFKEAYEELNPDNEMETSVVDKVAFDVNVTSGSTLGALTGALIAGKKTKADILKRQFEDDATKNLEGNYYNQVQNLIQNLKPIFTPFGVVYVVKSNGREITIETIETEEMNKDMYAAWQHKDYHYFTNLLLNKMHSDIQMVEQNFAKKMLEKQMGLQNQVQSNMGKKASEEAINFDDVTMPEMLDQMIRTKELYGKQSDYTEKIAGIMINLMDGEDYKIEWGLERPFDKYAGVDTALSFMGLKDNTSDIKSLQQHYLNPGYLADKVKVGFLPDRVLFIVDNKVLSTLPALKMNEDAFSHFEKQDKLYFVDMFNKETKKGVARIKGRIPTNSEKIKDESIQEKKAADQGIGQIFERSMFTQ